MAQMSVDISISKTITSFRFGGICSPDERSEIRGVKPLSIKCGTDAPDFIWVQRVIYGKRRHLCEGRHLCDAPYTASFRGAAQRRAGSHSRKLRNSGSSMANNVIYANDVINTQDVIYVKKRHLCGYGHLWIKA
jgi:hypothetical protein